jgi:hypothetical protein
METWRNSKKLCVHMCMCACMHTLLHVFQSRLLLETQILFAEAPFHHILCLHNKLLCNVTTVQWELLQKIRSTIKTEMTFK